MPPTRTHHITEQRDPGRKDMTPEERSFRAQELTADALEAISGQLLDLTQLLIQQARTPPTR